MDKYTEDSKSSLDNRYSYFDSSGIYFAHQPIYGFRGGHSEPDLFDRYIRTYNIMRALGRLRFTTLLDVGSAEGYKGYLASRFFGAEVTACDLSEEACKRSREIFGLKAQQGDIHRLPFQNDQFDVVLCSETLEHVTDFGRAVSELTRVARTAVVVTVPHDPPHLLHRHIESGTPHIRSLGLHSFDFLRQSGFQVEGQRMLCPLLRLPEVLVEAAPRSHHELTRYPSSFFTLYNRALPGLRRLPAGAASLLVALDAFASRTTNSYRAMLFVLTKEAGATKVRSRDVRPSEIISFSVPYHRQAGLPKDSQLPQS